jgi:hypothetical protein
MERKDFDYWKNNKDHYLAISIERFTTLEDFLKFAEKDLEDEDVLLDLEDIVESYTECDNCSDLVWDVYDYLRKKCEEIEDAESVLFDICKFLKNNQTEYGETELYSYVIKKCKKLGIGY